MDPVDLAFNDVGITADDDTAPGNWDGGGASFSETVALTAGKTVASITLPPGGAPTTGTPTAMKPTMRTSAAASAAIAAGATVK